MPDQTVLLVLAGPAGSGKTTLCERMVADAPGFSRVVTSTTRPPRPGEINGTHYHFFSPEEFDQRLASGQFLEWAQVHGKHRYGTLASSVLDPLANGQNLIINIDVQGVENFRRAASTHPLLAQHMGTVFIHVPIPVLRQRMAERGTESEAEIDRRMQTAEQELARAPMFDHLIHSASREEDFAALLALARRIATR